MNANQAGCLLLRSQSPISAAGAMRKKAAAWVQDVSCSERKKVIAAGTAMMQARSSPVTRSGLLLIRPATKPASRAKPIPYTMLKTMKRGVAGA